MPKATTSAANKLPTSRALLRQTWRDMWGNRRSMAPIILLVMVPVAILNLLTGNDATIGTYGSFVTLVMNLAVIYVVLGIKAGKPKPSLGEVYYGGTARFVAFVAVVGLLALQMIPLVLGGLVYLSGSSGATVGLTGGDIVILGGLWLLIALPTFRWVTRSVFALFIVQDPTIRPVAAVKQSSALVRGRSWRVAGRLLVASIVAIVVLLVPSLAISTLPASASWLAQAGSVALQLISALLLVPFAAFYGLNLLEALRGKQATSK